MTKTPDPTCVDCEGTGIDIVFGGPCVCTGKSKVKAAHAVAAAPVDSAESPSLVKASAAALTAAGHAEIISTRRVPTALHGKPLEPAYVMHNGQVAQYGMNVTSELKPGVSGIILCSHKYNCELTNRNYGKVKLLEPSGHISTRTACWLRPV